MATTLASVQSREVLRCDRCRLVQFRTSGGHCRRCLKPLEADEPTPAPLPLAPVQAAPRQELDVAQAVRGIRHARGLSQRQLATRMEVPRTYISKIENGKAMPTLSSLERLASALEASIGDLLRGGGATRREEALAAVLADPFLRELLPHAARLSAYQQQTVLREARDLAREAVPGRMHLLRA